MRGSVKRLGENRWRLVYDLPAENGKRRQQKRTFTGTKRDAERELARRIEEVRGGYRGSADTVAQFLRGWIDSRTVSANTRKTFENALKYVEPEFGPLALSELQPAHLQHFYARLLKHGAIRGTHRALKASSVERIHVFLKTALGDAHRMGLVAFNPAERVRAPKAPSRIPRVLRPNEVQDILDRLRGTEWWFFAFLASITGARLGELAGLERRDFHLDEAVLVIERSIDPDGNVKPPKNGKPRVVPLPPALVPIIGEYLPSSGRLFPWIAENTASASARFVHHLKGLGYEGVHPHTFRHTVGSVLMTKSIHPKAIQQLLGHHDVAYTMKVYSHLMPGAFEDTTTPLGDLVRDQSVTFGTTDEVESRVG